LNYDKRDCDERRKGKKFGKGVSGGDVMISKLMKGNL